MINALPTNDYVNARVQVFTITAYPILIKPVYFLLLTN